MKKICLTVVGMYLMLLHAFSQVAPKDTAAYQVKKLKLEEINLVSGYYNQTGDHSAIRKGKGSSFSLGGYYSAEYNYQSVGLSAGFTRKTHNNGEFRVKLSGYFDQVKMIQPSECNPADEDHAVLLHFSFLPVLHAVGGELFRSL
jgi:hypothetical protein